VRESKPRLPFIDPNARSLCEQTPTFNDELQLSLRPVATEDFDEFIGYWTVWTDGPALPDAAATGLARRKVLQTPIGNRSRDCRPAKSNIFTLPPEWAQPNHSLAPPQQRGFDTWSTKRADRRAAHLDVHRAFSKQLSLLCSPNKKL
jgi:hypothetical protein